MKAGGRIIERLRIQRRDLHATDAGGLHLFKLSLQFGFDHSRPKPPPAHHDPAVFWGRFESSIQLRDFGLCLHAGYYSGGQQKQQEQASSVGRSASISIESFAESAHKNRARLLNVCDGNCERRQRDCGTGGLGGARRAFSAGLIDNCHGTNFHACG